MGVHRGRYEKPGTPELFGEGYERRFAHDLDQLGGEAVIKGHES